MRHVLFLVVCVLTLSADGQTYLFDEQFNAAPTPPASIAFDGAAFGAVSGTGNFGRNAPAINFNSTGQFLSYGPWTGAADNVSFFMKGSTGAASFFSWCNNQQYFASPGATDAGDTYVFVGSSIGYALTSNCLFLVLPVVLDSFYAEPAASEVRIHWSTLSEHEVKRFVLERSADAEWFVAIGEVIPENAMHGAAYSFTDTKPLHGVNYYRLRIENENGSVDYSPLAAAYALSASSMRAQWNESELVIAGIPANQRVDVTVYAMHGQLLNEYTSAGNPDGVMHCTLREPMSGAIVVVVRCAGEVYTARLIPSEEWMDFH